MRHTPCDRAPCDRTPCDRRSPRLPSDRSGYAAVGMLYALSVNISTTTQVPVYAPMVMMYGGRLASSDLEGATVSNGEPACTLYPVLVPCLYPYPYSASALHPCLCPAPCLCSALCLYPAPCLCPVPCL